VFLEYQGRIFVPFPLPKLDETPRRFRECDDFCIMTGITWSTAYFPPGTTYSSSFLFLPDMTPSEASGFFSLAGATTELQVCISTGVSTGKVFHPFFPGD
jgi:hypothetical protein